MHYPHLPVQIFSSPPVGMLSIVINVSVSCLSARVSEKPQNQIFSRPTYTLPVAVAQSCADDNAIRYILPVLWMI